jgi:hypothetical protein
MLLLQTICSGESFSWNGTDYTTQAGTRIAKDGCTADQVLNLTVTPNQRMYYAKQSVPETFPWNGTNYTTTQAGTRIAKMAVLLIKF